jgi:hypothetical protein
VLRIVAGALQGAGLPISPPKDSWAARDDAGVAIWTIRMEPGALWTLPAARQRGVRRSLYVFGGSAQVAGDACGSGTGLEIAPTADLELVAGAGGAECLLLQGRPIGEPVAQYGPFVMNTEAQLREAFADYRRTGFGGWPWPEPGPVHGPEPLRFARHADGRVETMKLGRAALAATAGDADRAVMGEPVEPPHPHSGASASVAASEALVENNARGVQ